MTVVAKISTYPHHLDEPLKIHHVSSIKNASFHPHPVMPCSTDTKESCCRLVHRCLTFSSSEDNDDDTPTDEIPSPNSTLPVQHHTDAFQQPPSKCTLNVYVILEAEEEEDVEEDFQTMPLYDEHWDMEEIPNRPLCIHEHSLPHRLCPYPCPYLDYQASSYYDTLDLSDISQFKDLMTTSSDEDIPALNDIGY